MFITPLYPLLKLPHFSSFRYTFVTCLSFIACHRSLQPETFRLWNSVQFLHKLFNFFIVPELEKNDVQLVQEALGLVYWAHLPHTGCSLNATLLPGPSRKLTILFSITILFEKISGPTNGSKETHKVELAYTATNVIREGQYYSSSSIYLSRQHMDRQTEVRRLIRLNWLLRQQMW